MPDDSRDDQTDLVHAWQHAAQARTSNARSSTQANADAPSPPKPRRSRKRWLIAIAVVTVFLFWQAGTFDHALVSVGLNANECGRNGFGATFCGNELTEYRGRQEQAKREGEAAGHKIEEEGQEAKRRAEEAERQLQQIPPG